jgi:curli biogenesis system outer membrane secretion channel CsgG
VVTIISRIGAALLAPAVLLCSVLPAHAAGAQPRIAVSPFSSAGLNPWWGPNVDPGAALADILSDRLVHAGTYAVIDRDHVDQVLREQNLSRTGDVTPATESKLGRMLGVSYLFVGRVVQFDKTAAQGGALGGIIRGALGGAAVGNTKTVLRVSLKVIEANSGRIVEAIDDEQSASASSFTVGGAGFGSGGAAGGKYTSSEFQSSAMGKLLTSVADDLTAKLDAGKLVPSAPAAAVGGRILSTEGGTIVLNIGSDKGVQDGMIFDVVDVKTFTDPDTHRPITTEIKRGSIQVISVSRDSALAKKISGTVHALDHVKSE